MTDRLTGLVETVLAVVATFGLSVAPASAAALLYTPEIDAALGVFLLSLPAVIYAVVAVVGITLKNARGSRARTAMGVISSGGILTFFILTEFGSYWTVANSAQQLVTQFSYPIFILMMFVTIRIVLFSADHPETISTKINEKRLSLGVEPSSSTSS